MRDRRAGDTAPVDAALRRLAAMRSYMRDVFMGREGQEDIAKAVGMDGATIQRMYRLLAIAKYDDRFVIPTSHPEMPRGITQLEGCSVPQDVEAFHGAGPASPGVTRPAGAPLLPLEVLR